MKKIISLALVIMICAMPVLNAFAYQGTKNMAELTNGNSSQHVVNAKSAVLMEAKTGKVLYSYNEETRYSPASVTKVMTLLLQKVHGLRLRLLPT